MRGFGELGMLALMGRGVLATSFDGLVNKETTASHLELSPPGLAVSPFFLILVFFFLVRLCRRILLVATKISP